jgi:hypothetical protein
MEVFAIVAVLVTAECSDAADVDVDVQSDIPSVTATSLLPSANKKSGDKAAGVEGAIHWRCSTEAAPWVDRSADVMRRDGVAEEEAASRVEEHTAVPRDICTPIVRAACMMHMCA